MKTQSSHHFAESEQNLVDAEHPWPGLASFREQDEHFFKGREADIETLHNLVLRERLTVLFAVSGLGKSSLLQAGLFPRLREKNVLPVFIRLDFGDAAPNFIEQVFATIDRQIQEKAIEAPVYQTKQTLWEYFHGKRAQFWDARNRLVMPLLCFDQFEEIFSLSREATCRRLELKQLLAQLADLVEGRCPESLKQHLDNNPNDAQNFSFSRHPYKLIFSLREDYLADLEGMRSLMPSIIYNRMRLRHMNFEQALAVANQTQGRLMDSSISETVVRLVAGEQRETHRTLNSLYVEPALLSLVCRELNERRIATRAKQIDAQTVASNRDQILENFYERSLAEHSPQTRWFIEDKLITLSGFRNSEAYENALGTPGVSAEALNDLVQRRLLRLEECYGVKRIELIHDVLTGVVRKSRDQRHILEKQRQAEQERSEAEQREQAALEALRRTQHALAIADFREAEWLYQSNAIPFALAYLANAVRLDLDWVSSKTLLVNLLQQRGWILPEVNFNQKNNIIYAAFSPDGARLLTELVDRTARLWDTQTGQPVGEEMNTNNHGHDHSAYFSPDGSRVVTASCDNTVRLWDVKSGQPLGEVMRHQDKIRSAYFSPDGTQVLTASYDKSARLWDAKTGQPLGEAMTHQGEVISAQFSPDGMRVVTTSWDDTARLWNANTGQPMGEAMIHQSQIISAKFSPDGTWIETFPNEGGKQLWDAKTGQPLSDSIIDQENKNFVHFSPDGTKVVIASDDNNWRLMNIKTGQPLSEAIMDRDDINSVLFSPDGTRVVTTSNDNSAQLWDASNGQLLGEAMKHNNKINFVHFSADGTQVLTVSGDKTAQLWETNTGQPLGEAMIHKDAVWFAKINPDGKQVLTVSGDKTARLWDTKMGKLQGEAMSNYFDNSLNCIQFSPTGMHVLTTSYGQALLWGTKNGQALSIPMTHKNTVKFAQFSPDGTQVLTASMDGSAQLWDAKTGQPMGKAMTHQGAVLSAHFSPDGTKVVTASRDESARLWDAKTGKPLGEAMMHQGFVMSAQFSPNGKQVVTASSDRSARLWDATNGKRLSGEMWHMGGLSSAQFSPDGTQVVTASSENHSVQLWDSKTCQPLGEAMKYDDNIDFAQFSPDGKRVVALSSHGGVALWDAKTCKPLYTNHSVRSIQYSPDGTRLLTTSSVDNSARLWERKTGKPLGDVMTHRSIVISAQFSPDGTKVVTASSDKSARLWDAKTGKPLGEAMMHQGAVRSAQFSPDGTRVVTASKHTAHLWDVSPVVSGNLQLLETLAEAVAGNTLSELGAVASVENQIEGLDKLRRQTANAPLGKPTAESFIRWFLSDPWTRTISPLSSLTVPDYIQQQIAAGRRDQVEHEFPRHPLLHPSSVPIPAKPTE